MEFLESEQLQVDLPSIVLKIVKDEILHNTFLETASLGTDWFMLRNLRNITNVIILRNHWHSMCAPRKNVLT